MAGNEVTLSTRADLKKLIDELAKVKKMAEEVSEGVQTMGKETDESFTRQTKKSENYLTQLRSYTRRLADQMRSDFKSLVSLESLAAGLKISNQFKGAIKETFDLSDQIRKLGGTFGLTSKEFAGFQTKMVKGLGQLGLSSEVATNALRGLSETQVRGQENLLEYSKAAGMLGTITGRPGQEAETVKGMAGVIQSRGGNVNDMKEMKNLTEDLVRAFKTTGRAPQEMLNDMEQIFTGMSEDFRKSMSSRSMVQMAAGAAIAGPNATKFLESYFKMSKFQRAGLEARGVGELFGPKGLNPDAIRKFYDEAKKLGSGDMRLGLKAMGVEGDDAAEGFMRLADNMDRIKETQDKINASTVDLNKTFEESKGFAESFRSSINKVKGILSAPLSELTQTGTKFLQGAGKSDVGAAGVVLGGGLLASMLAGGGLRGIGSMFTGTMKSKAYEAATGERVQPVNVINADEIAGKTGGIINGTLGKLGSMGAFAMKGLGALGAVGAAGAAGVAIGEGLNAVIEEKTQGKTSEGFEGNMVERLFFKLDKLLGGEASTTYMKYSGGNQKVDVNIEMNDPRLKAAKKPIRSMQ